MPIRASTTIICFPTSKNVCKKLIIVVPLVLKIGAWG